MTERPLRDPLQEASVGVLKKVSITDIRAVRMNAELKSAEVVLPLETDASLVESTFERHPLLVIYELTYRFAAKDKKATPVWNASFALSLSFRLNEGTEVSDEELRAFGARGVIEIAHPYARELVHHVTSRMRVPAFILEVLTPFEG